MVTKPRPRKCKVCGALYTPRRSIQPTCDGFECNVAYATRQAEKLAERRAKAERQQTRQARMNAKPLQYWLKRAEKAVNAYVRIRDRDEPCISCRTWDTVRWEAGHFISVGASSSTRFDPANIHKQCHRCNCEQGGRQADYEAYLRIKSGDAEVDRLKAAPRLRIWTREELQAIEAEFKQKARELQKNLP